MNWDQLLIPLFQIIHKSRRDEADNARISSAVIKRCMLKQHQRFASSWAGLNQKWWRGTCNSFWEWIKLNHAQRQVYNDVKQNHMLCMTIQRPAHKHTAIGGGTFLLVWFIWWNCNLKYWSLSTILTLSWFWATQMTLITIYPLCHEVCQPLLFPSHDCFSRTYLPRFCKDKDPIVLWNCCGQSYLPASLNWEVRQTWWYPAHLCHLETCAICSKSTKSM